MDLEGIIKGSLLENMGQNHETELQQDRTVLKQPHRPIQDEHEDSGLKLGAFKSANFFFSEIKVSSSGPRVEMHRTLWNQPAERLHIQRCFGQPCLLLVPGLSGPASEILEPLTLPSADLMEISGVSELTERNTSLILF